ncbi:MAG: TIGR04255 family protein, partial [Nitrospira sp.]|nr:TIGR04255 family protein [Nitrospira sp.]
TFSRLKPYDKWTTLRDEAQELWQHYVRIASPQTVTRVALRYINRIEIPLPMRDFKDYILTTPETAPDLPQGLDNFFMRLVIPDPKGQAVAIVTETVEPIDELSNRLPLIFDIDVFRAGAFNVQDNSMWETFESLHDLKNDIFFKSLTPKAKELFR